MSVLQALASDKVEAIHTLLQKPEKKIDNKEVIGEFLKADFHAAEVTATLSELQPFLEGVELDAVPDVVSDCGDDNGESDSDDSRTRDEDSLFSDVSVV